jgi:hypothetical protein
MKIGFTGTQHGMSKFQKKLLRRLLDNDLDEFHHGDCVGADAEAHNIADTERCACAIVIHPPSDSRKRAFKKVHDQDQMIKPKPYIQRNKDIVNAVDLLIAAPRSNKEELRSGTWSTVRYAKKI